MDGVTKAVGAFVVFCVGVAIIILACSWAFRPNQQATYEHTRYYTCPHCQRQFELELPSPRRPNEVMPGPSPLYPRPGSKVGDKGAADKVEGQK